MAIKIGAFGYGLAAILGAGTILLAALNNSAWKVILVAALFVWIFSVIAKKI